jgi:rod shape-determining protein MreC
MRAFSAQWKLTALLLCLLLLALLLTTLRTRVVTQTPLLERVLMSVIMPVQWGVTEVVRNLRDTWNGHVNLIQVRQENLRLQRQIAALQGQLHLYQEAYLQQQRLHDLLGIRSLIFPNTVVAEVIGIDPSQWSEAVTINKGQRDAVRKDSAVLTPQGLVGRTIDIASSYAIVLLVTDPRSVVDAMVQRSRARGIVVGKSRRLCELRYVDFHADIQVGDTIISSGLGDVYPKGLRIGTVASVRQRPYGMFYEIEVQPAVDFAKLEEVLVVVP